MIRGFICRKRIWELGMIDGTMDSVVYQKIQQPYTNEDADCCAVTRRLIWVMLYYCHYLVCKSLNAASDRVFTCIRVIKFELNQNMSSLNACTVTKLMKHYFCAYE